MVNPGDANEGGSDGMGSSQVRRVSLRVMVLTVLGHDPGKPLECQVQRHDAW